MAERPDHSVPGTEPAPGAGRLLAIGDIHGCDVALATLLSALSPSSDDTVVLLGDIVDRGPGSRQVVEQILALRESTNVVFIRGNHEEMMVEALVQGRGLDAWLHFGGAATLFSYDGDPRSVPREHLEFLQSSVDFRETERELFIHANLKPGVPLERQDAQWLRWTHLTGGEAPHPSGKRVICGHTPQKSGSPLCLPGWVCIDTYAYGSGWLTGLDVGSNEIVQANQARQLRSDRL